MGFTGGLLVGKGFISRLYVHMGFHPAWKYETVHESTFCGGKLSERRDLSEAMASLWDQRAGKPLRPGLATDDADTMSWIQSTFSLDY